MVLWHLEVAGVGPEAGPVAVAVMVEAGVLGRRSRLRQSCDSGCEVEAVAAGAGERKAEGGKGRSLLAWLLMGYLAGVEGEQRRAALGSGEADRGVNGAVGEVQQARAELQVFR